MSLIAAYIFNEYSDSGVPESILDWSPSQYNAGASGISLAKEQDGYDAVFGGGGTISYSSSPSFCFGSAQQTFTVAFKVKFTSNTFYLINYPGVFNIQITSAGTVEFVIYTTSTTTASITSSAAINDGNYHTIQCSGDGTTMYIYIDGVLNTSGACAYANLQPATYNLLIGAQTTSSSDYFSGNLNYVIFYTSVLSLSDSVTLAEAAHKGLDLQGAHSFQAGDLLGNATQTIHGAVTYVASSTQFTVLPYNAFNATNLFKYGNLFNPLRQSIMEVDNDFDGNGNAQIRIKYPVCNFNDLRLTTYNLQLDYRGVTNIPGTGLTWLMEYTQRPNVAGKNTNAYNDVLDSNMLATEGDYATFRYLFQVNVTGGTVKIILNNTTLLTITPTSTGLYFIEGEICATSIIDGSALIMLKDNFSNITTLTKTINFKAQNKMILQLHSTYNNDLVAIRGTGIVYNTNIGN